MRFWDARQEQGALVLTTKDSLDYFYDDAAFSRDGRWIIDTDGDRPRRSHRRSRANDPGRERTDRFSDTALYPDGHRAVVFRYKSARAVHKPGELVLWDLDSGRELKKLDGVPCPADLAVSPDGRWLLALNRREGDKTYFQRELIVRDAATWEPVLHTEGSASLRSIRCVHEGFERGRRG